MSMSATAFLVFGSRLPKRAEYVDSIEQILPDGLSITYAGYGDSSDDEKEFVVCLDAFESPSVWSDWDGVTDVDDDYAGSMTDVQRETIYRFAEAHCLQPPRWMLVVQYG